MNNGFFEKPNYITSYRSSIDTIALNYLVFRFYRFWGVLGFWGVWWFWGFWVFGGFGVFGFFLGVWGFRVFGGFGVTVKGLAG